MKAELSMGYVAAITLVLVAALVLFPVWGSISSTSE